MGISARAERAAAKLPTPYVVALPAHAELPPLREMVLDGDIDEDAHAAVDLEPAPEARLTFVMIAPLMRDKGVFEFAEAARRLRAQQRDVRFVLVGVGAVPRAQLEEWVAEGRLDHFPDGDARAWIRKAHVIVLPFHRENYPRVVLDAMTLVRPSIVSDASGQGMTLIVRTPALLGPWSRAADAAVRAKFPESLRVAETVASDPAVPPPNLAIEPAKRPLIKTLAPLVAAISALVAGALMWTTLHREAVVASAPRRVLAAVEPAATRPHANLIARAPNLVAVAGAPAAAEPVESVIVAPIVSDAGRAKKERARLAALTTKGRLDQLKVKRVEYLLGIEGERAVIEGRSPSVEGGITGFAKQKAALLSRYNARIAALESERDVLTTRWLQRESEVKRLSSHLVALAHDERIAEDELARAAALHKHRLTTRDHLHEVERDAGTRRQQYLEARDQLTRAESELAEVERNLEELELKTRADAEEAIAKHIADLAELDAALANEQPRGP